MEMDLTKRISSGSSVARERQGGYCPALPPRSCAPHESCDGLPAASMASEAGERTIAEKWSREKDDRMEVWEDRKKDGAEGFAEGITSSDLECTDEEFEKRMDKVELYEMPCIGTFDKADMEEIRYKVYMDFKDFRTGDKSSFMMDMIEVVGAKALDTEVEDRKKRIVISACAHTASRVVKSLEDEINMKEERIKRYRERYLNMKGMYESYKRKYESLINKVTKEEEIQTCAETRVEVEVVERRKDGLEEKIESLLGRIEDLERRIPNREGNFNKEGEVVPWTKVLERRRRLEKEGRLIQKNQEEGERQRSKSRNRPLKALEKRLPKGSGVIIEIQGGGSKEYVEVIKECERTIPLDEIGIPSIGIRRTRGGGVFMEIQGDQEEEKAERLAGRIKEVIEKKEGVRVWSLRKRVRIRLTGLPPGAKVEKIAAMVAKEGGSDAGRIRVGPLRTSVSGAGTAWVDCPREMAVRVAGAPGFTMG